MKEIQLKNQLADDSVDKLKGQMAEDSHYAMLIEEDCAVYKPDGSLLFMLVKGMLGFNGEDRAAFTALQGDILRTTNRLTGYGKHVMAAGVMGAGSPRSYAIKKDGTLSNTIKTINPDTGNPIIVNSGVIGCFDRTPRFPYARAVAFLINHPKKWKALQPMIRSVNTIFEQHAPLQYQIQKAIASKIDPAWVIEGTAFTTLTVNKTFRISYHKDAGDLAEGLGVMAYFQRGQISGGRLVIPKFEVAVNFEHGDVILFDVHEWHGVTEIQKQTPDAERLTIVFYLREALLKCGNVEHEQEFAKNFLINRKLYLEEEHKKGIDAKSDVMKIVHAATLKAKAFSYPVVVVDKPENIYLQHDELLSIEHAESLSGSFAQETHYRYLINSECSVYKPGGGLLLKLIKNVIPVDIGATAYGILAKAKMIVPTGRNNRGLATGKSDGRATTKAVLTNGQSSNQNINTEESKSGVIGYFNREPRLPYCRETVYLRKHPEDWKALQPFIASVDKAFAFHAPEHHARQQEIADQCSSDFIINGTAFSTITVNKNWQTSYHRDDGDCKEGLGVLADLRGGEFTGGVLVLPRFRVAVQMESCDVLLFDVHELHGNSEIIGNPNKYCRITAVFYLREKMIDCECASEEYLRVKSRKVGTPLLPNPSLLQPAETPM